VAVLVATSGLHTSSYHQQHHLFAENAALGVDRFHHQLGGFDRRDAIGGKVATVRSGNTKCNGNDLFFNDNFLSQQLIKLFCKFIDFFT